MEFLAPSLKVPATQARGPELSNYPPSPMCATEQGMGAWTCDPVLRRQREAERPVGEPLSSKYETLS